MRLCRNPRRALNLPAVTESILPADGIPDGISKAKIVKQGWNPGYKTGITTKRRKKPADYGTVSERVT
jgi:hypothetical protein